MQGVYSHPDHPALAAPMQKYDIHPVLAAPMQKYDIHPALAAPNLLYDVRYHPSQFNTRLSPAVLAKPASSRPLPSLELRVDGLPWSLTVWPQSGSPSGSGFVTIQDVLLAIYFYFGKKVMGSEYEAESQSRKAGIEREFRQRTSTDRIQYGKGMRRVDFLGGRFRVQGLVRAQYNDSIWDVVITR